MMAGLLDRVILQKMWTPLEISIVSVPADATVGVGRTYNGPEISPAIQPTELSVLERIVQANENLMKAQRK